MKPSAMIKIPDWVKKIVALCLAGVLGLVAIQIFAPQPAASEQDPRVSRLEIDVSSLRSQLNRVESHLYRLSNRSVSQSARDERTEVSPSPPPPIPVTPPDPMFDRLANLVVDLKERVGKIENRLSRLESP